MHRMIEDQEHTWECPECDHRLQYAPRDADVAKLAMVSHLARAHKMTFWQVITKAPGTEQAAEEYFGRR